MALEGFSTPSAGGGWDLDRLVIVCCAADVAVAVQVHIDGVPDPGTIAWVRVTGTWVDGTSSPAALRATRSTPIDPPKNAYE